MSGQSFQVVQNPPDTVSVSGALTFATAAAALEAIRAALPGRQVLDLAGVDHSDSAVWPVCWRCWPQMVAR
jgi:phospholipid transport system transporter-binding protein